MTTMRAPVRLDDLAWFAAAVEHGGFAPAGRALGVPKSTISKRVAELEAALAARLVQRTSRRFVLTEVGREVYDHARAALIEAEAAIAAVDRRAAEPRGVVRVTCAVPTAQLTLRLHLPALARRYPALHVQLDASDRFVDLVHEGYDIAVRSHFEPLPDSGLVARVVGSDPIILVAAPGYLAERDTPDSPGAVAAHDGLLVSPAARSWRLTEIASGEVVEVAPRPRFTANETSVLLEAARAGLGIVGAPARFCRDELAAGRLVHVLPGWTAGRVTTTLLVPHRRGQLPAVRATVEFLAACLEGAGSTL